MPNWVQTYISYSPEYADEVEKSVYDKDRKVDFRILRPFPGKHQIDRISLATQLSVSRVLGERYLPKMAKLSKNPFIYLLQSEVAGSNPISYRDAAREFLKLKGARAIMLKELAGSQEQLTSAMEMLENLAECGYMHSLQFATGVWGSKWNACHRQKAEEQVKGLLRFDTAWGSPDGWIEALSIAHPEVVFDVRYADEDIGSNTGYYRIQNGDYHRDENGIPILNMARFDDDEETRAIWRTFALMTWGNIPGLDTKNLLELPVKAVESDEKVDVPWVEEPTPVYEGFNTAKLPA